MRVSVCGEGNILKHVNMSLSSNFFILSDKNSTIKHEQQTFIVFTRIKIKTLLVL